MGKINILPSKVYNRIAAGEVVERPCSVVKELVENSIDAGATEIEIHIEKGGKQLIRVMDNGCGIERDDLHSAFLPHATSKIAQAEDLERIMTLGFRGEAIASIASVSQMSITSKTKDGKCYRLQSNGGELGQITEAAGENGTDVSVEMLFFNAPVRLNFLKTDKGEETEITTCVSRFILNRADIAFTYYVDGEKVLQSFAGGNEEALISVYGAAVLRECIEIDAEKHGVRVRGYIGNQNFYKANKSYQSVFLNGRYIVNATIASAISNAYASYLMKRQYPFYVLHITLPQEIVDVNVHPNKADVRFSDNKIVYGCIYSIISSVLDGSSKALEYVVKDEKEDLSMTNGGKIAPETTIESEKKDNAAIAEQSSKDKLFGFSTLTYEQAKLEMEMSKPDFSIKPPKSDLPFEDVGPMKGYTPKSQIGSNYVGGQSIKFPSAPTGRNPEKLLDTFPGLFYEETTFRVDDSQASMIPSSKPQEKQEEYEVRELDIFSLNKQYLEKMEQKAEQEKLDLNSFKYAGKLFNTYLLYERGDEIFIIDQHAAHERLIFNRLREKMRNRTVVVQPLLMPYEIELNHFEADFIKEREQDLLDMGVTVVEARKGVYHVTTIPMDAWKMDVNCFMHDILSEINGYRAIRLEDLIRDKLAASACKAAIKGGMDITQKEVDELFKLLDGNMGLKCPHGRPVVVTMTKKNIEKMFKRIV